MALKKSTKCGMIASNKYGMELNTLTHVLNGYRLLTDNTLGQESYSVN